MREMLPTKEDIATYAFSAVNHFVSFAKFVSYAEDLEQLGELFDNEEKQHSYQQRWFDLEIINALALSEWETEGKPNDWNSRWEADYKKEAAELIAALLTTLK